VLDLGFLPEIPKIPVEQEIILSPRKLKSGKKTRKKFLVKEKTEMVGDTLIDLGTEISIHSSGTLGTSTSGIIKFRYTHRKNINSFLSILRKKSRKLPGASMEKQTRVVPELHIPKFRETGTFIFWRYSITHFQVGVA
jgi:gas vesicle protein